MARGERGDVEGLDRPVGTASVSDATDRAPRLVCRNVWKLFGAKAEAWLAENGPNVPEAVRISLEQHALVCEALVASRRKLSEVVHQLRAVLTHAGPPQLGQIGTKQKFAELLPTSSIPSHRFRAGKRVILELHKKDTAAIIYKSIGR